jgi:hypothetical protein
MHNISIDEGTDVCGRCINLSVDDGLPFMWVYKYPDGRWNARWDSAVFFVGHNVTSAEYHDKYLFALDFVSDVCGTLYRSKLPYDEVKKIVTCMAVRLKLEGCV